MLRSLMSVWSVVWDSFGNPVTRLNGLSRSVTRFAKKFVTDPVA